MHYNRLNELVQQNNIRESTYKIVVDNAKKCAYSRVMVNNKGFKMSNKIPKELKELILKSHGKELEQLKELEEQRKIKALEQLRELSNKANKE